MRWVKQPCDSYRRPQVLALDNDAEVMWHRSRAYAGDGDGTHGFIPGAAVAMLMRGWTPAKGHKAAAALVREGLWEIVPGGWRIVGWDTDQSDLEAIVKRRQDDAARQADRRRRVRLDVEAPAEVLALRDALDAKGISPVWKSLTEDEVHEVSVLLSIHGQARLVQAAVDVFQPANPARSARAFLPSWRDLRAARVKPGRPEWCGRDGVCDPVTRMVGDDHPHRCEICGGTS